MGETRYNSHPISVRFGEVFLDGVKVMDGVSATITITYENWNGKQLGDIRDTIRTLGYSAKAVITQRRNTPFMIDLFRRFKKTRRTYEFTIQGIMADEGSDYFIENGGYTVTAKGCVLDGDINLLQLDSAGDVLEDTLNFIVADVDIT